jgi:multicomponent K+:H+ antiporter subunit E
MRSWLPAPGLSLGLLLLWILLMGSVSAGNLLLGLLLALFWPLVTRQLLGPRPRLRHPLVAAALAARVIGDMLRSNVRVAWLLLTRRSSEIRSGFVQIPLELQDPTGLAVLAMIVTFTPGTAWAQLGADNRSLLLHVLDIDDEAATVRLIKRRYEAPLRQVFE